MTPRWYVAWRPGFPAILRCKYPEHRHGEIGSLTEWRARAWHCFAGASPIISDVTESVRMVVDHWRTCKLWQGDGYVAPPLWMVASDDGGVVLTETPPGQDGLTLPLRPLENELIYFLLR